MNEWRPIDSVPKGVRVLVYSSEDGVITAEHLGNGVLFAEGYGDLNLEDVTHWMPLPEPPKP